MIIRDRGRQTPRRLVLRRGMLQVGLGVIVGVALAASTTPLLQSMLYGLTGTGPGVLLPHGGRRPGY